MDSSNPCEVDVVVVGAGFAGLSTAAGLAANGRGKTENVVILEANNRTGGRAWTLEDQFKEGYPLEAGASWTYPGTVLDRLAKQYGVKTVRSIFRDFQTLGLYNATGAISSPLFEELLNDNYKRTFVKFAADRADNALSIQDILNAYFESDECDANAESADGCSDTSEPHRQVINALAERIMGAEYGAPLDDLESEGPVFILGRGSGIGAPSTRANNVDYTAIPGGGYGNIIEGFVAENSLGDKIKLGRNVTEITQLADQVVVTAQTDGGLEYYTAAAAVVTASLGILKAGDITFEPPLSDEKMDAIDKLGMGTLNKVFLHWAVKPEQWPDGLVDLVLITPDDATSGELAYCINEQSQRGNEDYFTFLCWTSGDVAEALESKTDEELVGIAHENLQTMLGVGLAQPDESYVTRWKENPCTKGSYSYPPVGVDEEAVREELARPEDRVFFAGEATMLEDYGTAYGAYESGAEAAFELRRSRLY